MTLSTSTLGSLVSYWANRLGVDDDAFDRTGVTVGSADEGGIQMFQRGETLIVGVSEPHVVAVRKRFTDCDSSVVTEENALRRRFDSLGTVTAVFGPTFYGYADEGSFVPVASDARLLTEDDATAYEQFRTKVPNEEWENGGPEFNPGRIVGLFDDDELIAAAGYTVWDDFLAHIAVVVHPNHRGKGHGRSVVSRATEQALSDGLLPQYRTSDEWPWSVALAESLGFERFVTATLVRLE
ncbi:GNAT family N-acetyltransferase [Haladaptatus sp. DYF46]|uniref:GNAT family N-acetyltransferase n=1 Tax=Haladaptatus sp. DYF46 TaxID=2886041 RepID=UPI001E5861A3|nr:GNAT family N-acetyltransferase [Haladaptatus sp. DYF46]